MTRRYALLAALPVVLLGLGSAAPSYAARVPLELPGTGVRPLPLAPPPGSPAPPGACLLQVGRRATPAPRGIPMPAPLPAPPYTGGPLEVCPPVARAEGRTIPVLPASPGLEARR